MTAKVPAVRDFMTTKVISLKATMPITKAIQLLLKNQISGAPVVDEENVVVGIISEKDCLRLFSSGAYNLMPEADVGAYMSTNVMVISPEEGLFTVAGLFLSHAYRRLPVVENGHLVGVVSRRDVLDGSRKIWEDSPVKKPWTDAKYLTDEIKAALE